MAKDLGNRKDIKNSQSATESGRAIIKLKPPVSFAVIMSPEYEDEFAHFVNKKKIGCKAGLAGKGFAPDDCPKCADVMDMYQEAKDLVKDGDKAGGKVLREKANDLRGTYQAYFCGIVGEVLTKKDRRSGKKVQYPDFEDVTEIGILPLSEARRKKLFGLKDDPDYPDIKDGNDLVGRVLKFVLEEGTNKLLEVVPLEKFKVSMLKDVDLKDLPDLDSMVKLPEDYEKTLEDYESKDVEEEKKNDAVDDPDEIDLSKNKRDKNKKSTGKKASGKKSTGTRRRRR